MTEAKRNVTHSRQFHRSLKGAGTKPPKHVDVGPHRYKVKVDRTGALGDAGRSGQCSPSRLTITLDDGQAGTQLADSLLHELTHALLQAADLDEEVEERVCSILGPGLLGLLRSNPDLVAYVVGGAK